MGLERLSQQLTSSLPLKPSARMSKEMEARAHARAHTGNKSWFCTAHFLKKLRLPAVMVNYRGACRSHK